jgi:heme exporter protein A
MVTKRSAKTVSASLDFAFFQFLWQFYQANRGTIRSHYKELTRKFLDFNNPEKNPKAFLREPQFQALETYVFLKEFLGNAKVEEIFQQWFEKQGRFADRVEGGVVTGLAGQVGLEREAMAYAGHADGIKSTLTVRENLTFWAEIFGTGRIESALSAFDLAGLSDRAAGGLSAGQKRRLGLARMVVTGRPVWVLDEPTVSLDSSAVALFAQAVRAHLAGGGMALIATHIDLGLTEARVLDVTPYRAKAPAHDDFDGSFL